MKVMITCDFHESAMRFSQIPFTSLNSFALGFKVDSREMCGIRPTFRTFAVEAIEALDSRVPRNHQNGYVFDFHIQPRFKPKSRVVLRWKYTNQSGHQAIPIWLTFIVEFTNCNLSTQKKPIKTTITKETSIDWIRIKKVELLNCDPRKCLRHDPVPVFWISLWVVAKAKCLWAVSPYCFPKWFNTVRVASTQFQSCRIGKRFRWTHWFCGGIQERSFPADCMNLGRTSAFESSICILFGNGTQSERPNSSTCCCS